MARPTGIVYSDFTGNMSDDSGIALRARQVLAKIFRKVVGKTMFSDVALPISDATTQTALSDLKFYVKKGKKYRIEGVLITGGTAGGLKASITGPASTTLRVNMTSFVAAASATGQVTALATLGAGAASNFTLTLDGYIEPTANGYLGISASQASSNATATTVYAGSWVKLINVK